MQSVRGCKTLLATYILSGIISEVAAYTLLQHQGFAGNSVANLGLAGLLLIGLAAEKNGPERAAGIVGLLGGVVLLASGDVHGVGFTVGVLTRAGQRARSRRRQ